MQRGGGAPAREPVVNEDEQKAMMAFYYRKQEEMKANCRSCSNVQKHELVFTQQIRTVVLVFSETGRTR